MAESRGEHIDSTNRVAAIISIKGAGIGLPRSQLVIRNVSNVSKLEGGGG